ncbi:hypothetical protein QQF64_005688 [Cirrhinus molitorella]|uniref:Uncharacterized protein n=1 Tax=Cirrhinus molitorella TaxID=172907 RepID=A0ABR3MG60_9TELE
MPGDSAFPSGTPSFQLLINYSHISHPILLSLLNMRDLFLSPNSAVRGIVSELSVLDAGGRLLAAHLQLSPDSSAAKELIFTFAAMACHDALSINAYLAGFSSTHSVSRNRLKVHSSNPYHTTLPFHALQLLHPSICASHTLLVAHRP